jgi:hypothetical protein
MKTGAMAPACRFPLTCRLLFPVTSRLQASQEVRGERPECRVPKIEPLAEFLLVLQRQQAVQGCRFPLIRRLLQFHSIFAVNV